MNKAIRTITRAMKNPAVQRVVAWALPLVIGWILSKLDKKSSSKKKK